MGFWRLSRSSVGVIACLLVLVAALPAAARELPRRTYIVTVDVPGAEVASRTTTRQARQQLRSRRAASRAATGRVLASHDIEPRYRYSAAVSGFAARLTPQEAAQLARDDAVASVRPSRRVRAAAQRVPAGIVRVNADPGGGGSPAVDADIAIVDTGVGPAGDELNVQGGVDCVDVSWDPVDDYRDQDGQSNHGTHVAGIAAARDNDVGVVGVAPGARIWSVRVFDATASGDESWLLCGLDWILRTRLPGVPADQTIDVVNMSLEAPRAPFIETCDPADPDAIHVAVCNLDAAGIAVVAAAGNSARDAKTVVPAAYNQVITVGAINDYDGKRGGLGAAACLTLPRPGGDDRYAAYSNHGHDVDIVAPGTCVQSLRTSGDGDAVRSLQGTSQATPHVSGAVARYLAAHPGTSPARMRQIVRASGRLDWSLGSDPSWSGPADLDAPKRLLDVAAMQADPGVRVWLSDSDFKVGRRETDRQARVDVQRLGGFQGPVQLSLSGLPSSVGSASFDRPSATLGENGLGARLRLRLKLDGPQGHQDLAVLAQGSGGDPADSRGLSLLVDRRGPRITDLGPVFVTGATVGTSGAVTLAMRWQVSDKYSKVTRATLQRRVGSTSWRAVKGSLERAKVTLRPGQAGRFRVHAVDARGNARTSSPLNVSLRVREASSSDWQRPASGWRTQSSQSALERSLLTATGRTGSLRTSFFGDALALVAPVGPERGRLRLRIDGGEWREVDLRSAQAHPRRVVLSQKLTYGSHEVEVQAIRGKVAVDALLFLR